jgi:hypothetical protein
MLSGTEVSCRFPARQVRHGLQRALLEHAPLVFVVTGQANVVADDGRAIGPESERSLERPHQPAYGDQAGRDQHAAQRDLHRQQDIARGPAAAGARCSRSFQMQRGGGFPGVPGRADTKQEAGRERCREGKQEDAPVRRDIELDRKIQRRAPLAEQPE